MERSKGKLEENFVVRCGRGASWLTAMKFAYVLFGGPDFVVEIARDLRSFAREI